MTYSPASSRSATPVAVGSADLARATSGHDLTIQYQPTMNLANGSMTGFKALVRWSHPHVGLLDNESIVHLANQRGMTRAFSDWSLRAACRQLAEWNDKMLVVPGFRLAVDIAGMELDGERLVESVGDALTATGADGRALLVEVSETCAVDCGEAAFESVEGLHALGVELAIADSGSRYSTFARLEALPFDVLKINRSVVADADTDNGRLVLGALVGVGNDFDGRVVAEGVDSVERAALVRSLGGHEGRGCWAPALSARDAESVLVNGVWDTSLTVAV